MSAHQNVTPLFSPANASRFGGARPGGYAKAPLWAAGVRLPSMPKGLRPSVPKAVLLALAARADWNTGRCHPGLACLALDTGLDERTVRDGIAFLVARGLISRTRRGQGAEYTVLMPLADSPNVGPGPGIEVPNVGPGPGIEALEPPIPGPGPTKLEEERKKVRVPPVVPPSAAAVASPEAPPTNKPPPRTRDDRGCRIPDDWQPTPADCDFARKVGLNPDDVVPEFRDYWRAQAGRAGRKAGRNGWSLTFRNRCRQVAERLPRARSGPAPQRRPARNGAVEAFIRAKERTQGRDAGAGIVDRAVTITEGGYVLPF